MWVFKQTLNGTVVVKNNLSDEQIKHLAGLKNCFADYIVGIENDTDRKTALQIALDRTTTLGKIFYVKRGTTEPSIASGNLKRLHDHLETMLNEENEKKTYPKKRSLGMARF